VTAAAAAPRPFPTTHSPFAPLRARPYRIYISGQALASIGSWMQGIAQDWLVLQLTHSSTAVGLVLALQFLPMLVFGLHGGLLADRFPKKRILLVTQSVNTSFALLLAVLTLTGTIQVGHVYALALVGGLVFAVDAPTRQSFVTEVVGPDILRGAVSLNAAVFQATRLVGPALAGLLIGTVGTGWVFAANAACCIGPTIGLLRLRAEDLTPAPKAPREPQAVRSAARYVLARPHVFWTIVLAGVVGTFGLNFPIVVSAFATRTFGGTASTYAIFNVALAIGSMSGALVTGSLRTTRLRVIVGAGVAFGLVQALAALAPSVPAFFAVLVVLGVASMGFQSMANSSVQLWVDPEFRGRVMGLYMLVFIGGTTVGSPVVGELTNRFGPRVGMAFCGLVPALVALAVGLRHLAAARSRGVPARPGRVDPGRVDPGRMEQCRPRRRVPAATLARVTSWAGRSRTGRPGWRRRPRASFASRGRR
jgi:MFS family permease